MAETPLTPSPLHPLETIVETRTIASALHGTDDRWDANGAAVGLTGTFRRIRWENGTWSTFGPVRMLFAPDGEPRLRLADDGNLWLGRRDVSRPRG